MTYGRPGRVRLAQILISPSWKKGFRTQMVVETATVSLTLHEFCLYANLYPEVRSQLLEHIVQRYLKTRATPSASLNPGDVPVLPKLERVGAHSIHHLFKS